LTGKVISPLQPEISCFCSYPEATQWLKILLFSTRDLKPAFIKTEKMLNILELSFQLVEFTLILGVSPKGPTAKSVDNLDKLLSMRA